jgi:hypothetical protein
MAIVIASAVVLTACGGDASPTAPPRPQTYQLHVSGEWPHARAATFEDATWEVWWFRDYPSGGMCSPGPCGTHETVASGSIGRDGYFEGFSPEVECRDYRISVSGKYAQNRNPCTPSSQPVVCISEAQHFSDWDEWESLSCVDGGEPDPVVVTLDVTASWNQVAEEAVQGSWRIFGDWPITEYDTGSIPPTGDFRIETSLTCPVAYDWSLLELVIRTRSASGVEGIAGVECTSEPQQITINTIP